METCSYAHSHIVALVAKRHCGHTIRRVQFPISIFDVLISILLVAAGFVEEWLAGSEAGFGAVVDRVGSLLFLVAVAPERSGAMRAVFVERIEIDVEGAEFFLVVFVVVCNTA